MKKWLNIYYYSIDGVVNEDIEGTRIQMGYIYIFEMATLTHVYTSNQMKIAQARNLPPVCVRAFPRSRLTNDIVELCKLDFG